MKDVIKKLENETKKRSYSNEGINRKWLGGMPSKNYKNAMDDPEKLTINMLSKMISTATDKSFIEVLSIILAFVERWELETHLQPKTGNKVTFINLDDALFICTHFEEYIYPNYCNRK